MYSSVSALHLQGDLQLVLLPDIYGQQEFQRAGQMCRGNAAQGSEAVPKEGTQGTEQGSPDCGSEVVTKETVCPSDGGSEGHWAVPHQEGQATGPQVNHYVIA